MNAIKSNVILDDVTVTFTAKAGTGKDGLIHAVDAPENVPDDKMERSQKGSQKGSQKSSQKIIDLISQDTSLTTQAIADTLGISRRAVAKHIAALQLSGIIKRIGPDNGGHWEVLRNPTEAIPTGKKQNKNLN